MKKSILFIFSLYLTMSSQFTLLAHADKSPGVNRTHNAWNNSLKNKYQLTDQQINDLKAKGYSYQDIDRAAGLSTSSSRSIEDILRTRSEQHRSWSEIRRDLG